MRVCFFDDATGGHHEAFLRGLVGSAAQNGVDLLVAAPERPANLGPTAGRWIPVPSTLLRQVRTGRKNVRRIVDACVADNIEVFCSLFLEKSVWTLPRDVSRIERRVHVLHHANQYTYENRRPVQRIRTYLARRRVRRWADREDRFFVHTRRAHEIVSAVIPSRALVLRGYPVHVSAVDETGEPDPTPGPVIELLFVGQARHEKGLRYLLDALPLLPGDVMLRVVGPQIPATRSRLEAEHDTSRVVWTDRYVSASELTAQIRRASFVVLPYEAAYESHGGASGVLLDALANGAPIITTRALESQLPPQYRGAVVVDPEDPEALASGIAAAIRSLADLRSVSRVDGPDFVRHYHSFDSYLAALLAVDETG